MAARLRKNHQDDVRAKFYVYKFVDNAGVVAYVGKGSGRRFKVQQRNIKLNGEIVEYFKKESDAYAYEVQLISELKPYINKHPGGNGSKVVIVKYKKTAFDRLCENIGTKAVAARICLNYWWMIDSSKIEQLRRVAAYG